MFFPSFWWIFALFFGFFFYFHPGPAKSQENLEIGCRLSTAECCWVLLSAAECCWVLLRNPIPTLFPFVLCVFSHCFVQISLFFPQFLMDFCAIFWLRSHLFRPWPCKKSGKTPKYVADWALLRNAIPSLFPFVLLKFSWFLPLFLMGFGSFLQSFPLFFTWNCQKQSISIAFPMFSSSFWWIFALFFGFFFYFHPGPAKSQENLEIGCRLSTAECCWVLLSATECYWVLLSAAECCWVLLSATECYWVLLSAAECCWVLLRNPIPTLFPFVLCVFSHCFVQISLFFPQFLMDFCAIFWLRSHLFRPWPCKKSGKTPKWALLRNAIPSLFPFVLLKFSWFLPWFLMGFGQKQSISIAFPMFFPSFLIFCRFFFYFHPGPAKSQENLEIGCRLSTACWVLLSAAECCWVLLSVAECCWEIPFPPFLHLFCVCFPIVLSRYHCFSSIFDWFLRYFLVSFSPFSALTLQKVRKNSEICCRLSIAEKCNPQPFSICFAEVFLVFAMVFDGFWYFFSISPLVFHLESVKKMHFNSIPIVFRIVLFIVFPNFWWLFLASFSFSPRAWKKPKNLEISCRLSTADCWEMQSPCCFHLFCWSFLGFCHRFWWVLIFVELVQGGVIWFQLCSQKTGVIAMLFVYLW